MEKFMETFADIKHVVYINLESRPDRKIHIEAELQLLNLPFTRFNAISLENGAAGCSMSHLKCIQNARDSGWDHIMIVEDDAEFRDKELFIRQTNRFLYRHETGSWDVLLLAGNNQPPYVEIDDCCIKPTKCQTTTCYLVQSSYYDTLIQNIKQGLQQLMRNPDKPTTYAIDKHWFQLQEKDRWYLVIPLTVTQRDDYSDIEKKQTSYSRVMLDLEKKNFYRPTLRLSDDVSYHIDPGLLESLEKSRSRDRAPVMEKQLDHNP